MKNSNFPQLSLTQRMELLDIPLEGKIPVVIDSDTFNEIDDQYAIAWAMLNSERIDLQAIYAAPFTNSMFDNTHESVDDAEMGMRLSYDEILRVKERVSTPNKPIVLKGSKSYVKDAEQAESSPAVADLIKRAHECKGVLNVISIGAPTNIANALLIDPSLVKKIHVLWLGGHAFDWENTYEFNLLQDIDASRIILDSGVALTLFPCMGVTSALASSVPELEYYLKGTSKIGDYLATESSKCPWIGFGSRKVIWDIAPVGYALNSNWYTSQLVPSPVLNSNFTWSFSANRHLIRVIKYIERDELFIDMFNKLIKG
jgi:purine nucleosidase